MADLKNAMDALDRAARKTGADLAVDLEKAQNDLASVKESSRRSTQARAVGEIARATKTRSSTRSTPGRRSARRRCSRPSIPPTRRHLPARAQEARGRRHGARAELFTEFLSKFKNDGYAPNAQYCAGRDVLRRARFNDAIVEFKKGARRLEVVEKTADALLKIGSPSRRKATARTRCSSS